MAAIFLIAALAVAVLSHAWPNAAADPDQAPHKTDIDFKRGYQVIFFLMLLGPFPVLFLTWLVDKAADKGNHMVIVLEWWEIGLFGVFWYVETRRIGKITKAQQIPTENAPPTDPVTA